MIPEPFLVRRLVEGIPILRPPTAGVGPIEDAYSHLDTGSWIGVPAERRWAMEVLGLRADMGLDRTDIQKRFRRLLRVAHPDQGGSADGAAERIAELSEARTLLFHDAPDDADTP